MKNMRMTHKELVDQVSANLFKQSGKIESQRSWLAMRNYLEQLDIEQLKLMLKEATWKKFKIYFGKIICTLVDVDIRNDY